MTILYAIVLRVEEAYIFCGEVKYASYQQFWIVWYLQKQKKP